MGLDEPTTSHSLSHEVLEALADAKGVAPTELEIPLYQYIDPDALDDLFSSKPDGSERTMGKVVFTVKDATVVVSSDGTCSVVLDDESKS